MTQPTIILLAAGKNSRFFPLNTHFSKSGLEIVGKPLIIRAIESLAQNDFTDIVVVVRSNQEDVEEFKNLTEEFLPTTSIKIVTQAEPKGMGDAVLSVLKQLGSELQERILISNPYNPNLGSLAAEMLSLSVDQVVCAEETDRPQEYGILEVQNGKAVSIVEKPKPGTEPSSLKTNVAHLLDARFLDELAATESAEYNYETALNNWMKKSEVHVLQLNESLPSLKYPWQVYETARFLLNHADTSISDQARMAKTAVIDDSKGPVVISDGAVIGHAARIVGPTFIGANAFVGDFSLIRESSLEQNTTIGANTEVVRSVFLPASSMHFGYIADSIIGYRVKIGAGLITANKRLDRENIKVQVKGELVDIGRNNLGVVVGDASQIGIAVRSMPGTLVSPSSKVMPTELIKHVV